METKLKWFAFKLDLMKNTCKSDVFQTCRLVTFQAAAAIDYGSQIHGRTKGLLKDWQSYK